MEFFLIVGISTSMLLAVFAIYGLIEFFISVNRVKEEVNRLETNIASACRLADKNDTRLMALSYRMSELAEKINNLEAKKRK